jgi:ABC-type spermidine/putrescine transport system permease subunit I
MKLSSASYFGIQILDFRLFATGLLRKFKTLPSIFYLLSSTLCVHLPRFAFLLPLLPATYYLLPFSLLLLFYCYPLLSIFTISFAPEGQLDLAALSALVTTTYYSKTFWFTLWQAALSTALTLALALPVAHVFARYRFPGKSLLQALTTIPFV